MPNIDNLLSKKSFEEKHLIIQKKNAEEELKSLIEQLQNVKDLDINSAQNIISKKKTTLENKRNELSVIEKKQDEDYQEYIISSQEEKDLLLEGVKKTSMLHESLSNEIYELEEEINRLLRINNGDTISSQTNKLVFLIEETKTTIKELDLKLEELKSKDVVIRKIKTSDNKAFKRQVLDIQSKICVSGSYKTKHQKFALSNLLNITSSKSKHKSIYAVLYNILTRGEIVNPSEYLRENLNETDLDKVYKIQVLLLSLIREGELIDEKWIFKNSLNKDLINFAIKDLFDWATQLCEIAKIKFVKPDIIFSENEGILILFDDFSSDRNVYTINRFSGDTNANVWIEDKINYKIDINEQNHISILNKLLQWLFKFESFKEGQISILSNFLNGKNTLGILPTGGGKSLTYYFSVLLQPKISLIIAPINSLIKDQTDKLSELFFIDKYGIITSDDREQKEISLSRFKKGETLFTFASPERLQNKEFREILIKLSHVETIGTVVLDEVHCLSEWGHDFRVSYLMLSESLNTYCEGIKYLGLTATASLNVVRDLMIELSIEEKDVIYSKKLKRTNLNFSIETFHDEDEARRKVLGLINKNYKAKNMLDFDLENDNKNSSIIFCQTKSPKGLGVEKMYSQINEFFPNETAKYHGDDKHSQDAFMKDEKTILVATKAFGMGIDKPNVRMTIHLGMPGSREAFYQEAGRAGRDGKASECKLFSIKTNGYIKENINKFLNPRTNLEDLDGIRKQLRGFDISPIFYFFKQNVKSPVKEVEEAIGVYNELKNHNNYELNYNVVDNNYGNIKLNFEKNLYILFKLGIVNNWTIRYMSLKNLYFSIEVNRNFDSLTHIKSSAKKYINAYKKREDKNLIERDNVYVENIDAVKSIDDLDRIILEIRTWYHDVFVATRRVQISNMYSLIQQFENKPDSSNEIQDILEKYFDISEVIGLTSEGANLTFEENSISEVVELAFELENSQLMNRYINLERVLESVVNIKTDIYTSIISLRLNNFEINVNGKQRFLAAMDNLNEFEKNQLIESIISKYAHLNNQQKIEIINVIHNYDNKILHKLYEDNYADEVIINLVYQRLNNLLNERWK